MASRIHMAVHLALMLVIAGLVVLRLDSSRAHDLLVEKLNARALKAEQHARALLDEIEATRHELRFAREDERQARRELAAISRHLTGAGPAGDDPAATPALPHPDDPIFARLDPTDTSPSAEPADATVSSPSTPTRLATGEDGSTARLPSGQSPSDEPHAARSGAPVAPGSVASPSASDLDGLLAQAEKEVRERYRDQPELLARMLELLKRTRESSRPE